MKKILKAVREWFKPESEKLGEHYCRILNAEAKRLNIPRRYILS